MDLQLVLRPLSQFEEKLCHLYEWFAEQFTDDPEARFLFYRLASDEKAHVALIEYERRLVTQNPGLFGDVEVDLDVVQRAIQQVDQMQSGSPPSSLREAVTVAFEFEGSAAEYHYQTAVKQANQEVDRLLDSLGAADKQHIVALKQFAEKRGIPDVEG